MSTCEMLENTLSKIDESSENVEKQQKENGAGAMSSKDDHDVVNTPPNKTQEFTGDVAKLIHNKQTRTSKNDVHMTPPPPPPTTPVQEHVAKHPVDATTLNAQLESEITVDVGFDKCENTMDGIPTPPPMPNYLLAQPLKNNKIKCSSLKAEIKKAKHGLKSSIKDNKKDDKITVST